MSLDFLDLTSLPQRIIVQSLLGVLLLSGIAAVACLALRRNPLHRHTVATLALGACLSLPFISAWTAVNGSSLFRLPVLPPEPIAEQAVSNLTIEPTTTYFESVDLPAAPSFGPEHILPGVYLLGVLVGLARLGVGLLTAHRLVKSSVAASRETKAMLLGDRRDVRVRLTHRLAGPAVVGLLNPLILFPIELVSALDNKGIRQVIAHELSHIEEKHLWHALLHRITAILLWPIPTIHAVRRQAMIAQEDLCDSKAMAEGSAADYARLLVDLGERRPRLSHAWPICGIWSHNLTLEARIKSLLDPHRKPMTPMKPLTKAAVFGATLSTLLLLAGTQLARAQDPVVAGQAAPADVIIVSPAQEGQVVIEDRAQVTKSDRKAQRKAARKALRVARKRGQAVSEYLRIPLPGQAAPAGTKYDPFDENQTPGSPAIAPLAERDVTLPPAAGEPATIVIQDRIAPRISTTPLPRGQRVRVAAPRGFTTQSDAMPAIAPGGIQGTFPSAPARVDGTARVRYRTAPQRTRVTTDGQMVAPRVTLEGRDSSGRVTFRTTSPQAGFDGRIAPSTPFGQQAEPTGGVPVLRDVPVIGKLFRTKQDPIATEEKLVREKMAQDAVKARDIQVAKKDLRIVELERAKMAQDLARNQQVRYEVELAKAKMMQDATAARLQQFEKAKVAKLRVGKKTIIRNATVIIHEDGTVEIQGGKSSTAKPSTTKGKGK